MGTSSPSGGPANSTPLVPTWLDQDAGPSEAPPETEDPAVPPAAPPLGPIVLPVVPLPDINRFQVPRSNFSRFARSGGTDRASLGRALSNYVRSSAGGAQTATRRMAPARAAGARLVGFLADAVTRGAEAALRRFNLEALAGRPAPEVFVALTDFICQDGGPTDEGLARDAFLETVAELTEAGVTTLDALTPEQVALIFERFVAHSIEDRIVNDIGTRGIELPASNAAVLQIQEQLHDFVVNAVHDAIQRVGANLSALTSDRLDAVVRQIYEASFELVAQMAEGLAQ